MNQTQKISTTPEDKKNKKTFANKVFKKVWVSNLFNLFSPFVSFQRWIVSSSLIPNFLKYIFVRLKFKKEQSDYKEYNKKLSIYNEYLVENGLKPYPLMFDNVKDNEDFYYRYSQYQKEQLTLLYENKLVII